MGSFMNKKKEKIKKKERKGERKSNGQEIFGKDTHTHCHEPLHP